MGCLRSHSKDVAELEIQPHRGHCPGTLLSSLQTFTQPGPTAQATLVPSHLADIVPTSSKPATCTSAPTRGPTHSQGKAQGKEACERPRAPPMEARGQP